MRNHQPQTHQRMLLQSSALESVSIPANAGAVPDMAGVVPCRGERVSEETPLVPAGDLAGNHCPVTGAKAGVTCVFVLAKNKKPLMPCHPLRARELLNKGKALGLHVTISTCAETQFNRQRCEAPYRLTPWVSRRGLDPHERLTPTMLPMGRSNTKKLRETQCTESDYCLAMRIWPDSKTRLKHRASPPKRTNLIALNIQRSKELSGDFFLARLDPQLTLGECASSIVQIPRSHALDAAFTGNATTRRNWTMPILFIKAQGRRMHQRTGPDKVVFPRLYLPRTKMMHGFQTGDNSYSLATPNYNTQA